MNYLNICNINKFYGDKKVLSNVNMYIDKGDVVAILGKSGCGKTTLFNILAGFESLDSGKILLNGESIINKTKNISYMQQKPLLIPYMNVIDNICLYFNIKKEKKEKYYNIVEPILKEFGLWEHRFKLPNQLSGGMCQRVSFMRSYFMPCDFMLLDEPFSAIDTITKYELQVWFYNIIKKSKPTILFITHDIQEAVALSNKIYILCENTGTICKEFIINRASNNIEKFRISNSFNEQYNKILSFFMKIQ